MAARSTMPASLHVDMAVCGAMTPCHGRKGCRVDGRIRRSAAHQEDTHVGVRGLAGLANPGCRRARSARRPAITRFGLLHVGGDGRPSTWRVRPPGSRFGGVAKVIGPYSTCVERFRYRGIFLVLPQII